MAAMLCYSESVEQTPPSPILYPHHTPGTGRSSVLRWGVIRCSASSCVTPPPPPHGQPRHPRNRTFETMAIMLIRVGMCNNNTSLEQKICVAGGYKSVKPIILHCHSFNREMKVLSLANVDWDRKNRVLGSYNKEL